MYNIFLLINISVICFSNYSVRSVRTGTVLGLLCSYTLGAQNSALHKILNMNLQKNQRYPSPLQAFAHT